MADLPSSSAVSALVDADSNAAVFETDVSEIGSEAILETAEPNILIAEVAEAGAVDRVTDVDLIADAEADTNIEQPDFSTVGQIVLKLAVSPTALGSSVEVPERVVNAMQQLIDVIDRLRSPDSGWSPNIPQTPETLVPYVVEEVYDVLDALQDQADPIYLPQEGAETLDENLFSNQYYKGSINTEAEELTPEALKDFLWQNYFQIKTLSPWLLWAIARSTYPGMRLLEGLAANVFQPEQGWQTGILRLVATLCLKTPELTYVFDLATYKPSEYRLRSDAMVQTDDYGPCSNPTWVGGLLQSLVQQTQAATPDIRPFIDGVNVQALIPKKGWQFGTIQLHVEFEFIPDAKVHALPEVETEPDSLPEIAQSIATPSSHQLTSAVRFTDTGWLQRYTAIVAKQQLITILPYLPTVHSGESTAKVSPTALVKDACDVADCLQRSLVIASRNFPQQQWRLEDLRQRLLWCISRSAYEAMQMIGSIRASVLKPGHDWQMGTLRLVINLEIETPEADRHLDLATGQSLKPDIVWFAQDAIAQSHDVCWCYQPTLIQQLKTKAMQQIRQATPEVQLLLDGTYIDWLGADNQWQPGTIQLNVDFQFSPDYCSQYSQLSQE